MIAVALAVWNRAGYLRQSLASWETAVGHADEDVVFYVNAEPNAPTCVELAERFGDRHHVDLVVNDRRLGVSTNPWTVTDRAFADGHRFVVAADDDVVVSPDALVYLAWARDRYADDPGVLSVSTYQWADLGTGIADVFLSPHFKPLVWGITADRWYAELRDSWDHDYSTGQDLDGRWGHMQSGYDWNIYLRVKGDRRCVTPVVSRSQHVGKMGGTHCTPDMFEEHLAKRFNELEVVRDFRVVDVDLAAAL